MKFCRTLERYLLFRLFQLYKIILFCDVEICFSYLYVAFYV